MRKSGRLHANMNEELLMVAANPSLSCMLAHEQRTQTDRVLTVLQQEDGWLEAHNDDEMDTADDPILPAWCPDPEQADPGDVELLSEVRNVKHHKNTIQLSIATIWWSSLRP